MKAKLVSMQELTTDNPTFCLSPLRVFNECHKCESWKRAYDHGTVDKLKCRSHIQKRILDLLKRRTEIYKEIAKVNAFLEGFE